MDACKIELPCEYLLGHGVWQSPSEVYGWYRLKRQIKSFFDWALKRMEHNDDIRILDVGCGCGTDIFMFSLLGEAGKNLNFFLGADISIDSLRIANKLRGIKGIQNVSFICCSAESLPFRKETFDIVISSETLEHLRTPEKAIQQMEHVTKRYVLLSTINPRSYPQRFAKLILGDKIKRTKNYCYSRHGFIGMEIKRKMEKIEHISLIDYKTLRKIAANAGLRVIKKGGASIAIGLKFLDEHPLVFGLFLFFDSLVHKIISNPDFYWTKICLFEKEGARAKFNTYVKNEVKK